ncbi:MAG: WD40 repeat domain-containing protein [Thermoanaerobaculia bacterium]|nr:WD40 repeat domain-containing protein [Thermoanaerobaculia bacterium]
MTWRRSGVLRLWSLVDTRQLGRTLHHGSRLVGATLSPGGRFLISWGENGTVRLWDLEVDYDFPRQYLPLLVEATTGTHLNDLGEIEALAEDAWRNRRAEILRVQEEYGESVLTRRTCTPVFGGPSPPSSTESLKQAGQGVAHHSVY